jgi:ParB family transcriptional regulator, chromosome partitioning protein
MSRKDSKGMFAAVLGQLGDEKDNESRALRTTSPHLMKVAAGVRQMQERSEAADRLLKSGGHIVELDPEGIHQSMITDRFDNAYEAAAITEIVESMRERGQIVPGLVRPVPGEEGVFQIVYGRRRLAAAKQLGIKFKATVRELTDEQAVIFQGEENTAREDLSFIEKCAFAHSQEVAGFRRDTICSSLSTGKSHVSEMIRIASLIDRKILEAIGKAPGIGRGRWEEFSKRYVISGAATAVRDVLQMRKFGECSSDERFLLLWDALPENPSPVSTTATAMKPVVQKRKVRLWSSSDKSVSVALKDNGKAATILIKAAQGPRFAAFITDQLDALYDEFERSGKQTTGD